MCVRGRRLVTRSVATLKEITVLDFLPGAERRSAFSPHPGLS